MEPFEDNKSISSPTQLMLQQFFLDPDAVSKEYLIRVTNTFFRVDSIMSNITDLKKLLRLIMMESETLVDAEASSLLLYDEEKHDLYFEVALGPKGAEVKEFRVPLSQGIAGYCATNLESVNVKDAREDHRFLKQTDEKTKFVTKSIVAVPLFRKSKLIGVLEALNKKGGGAFSDEDVRILEVLGDMAAIAIENARLYEANLKAEKLAAVGQAISGVAHYVKNIVTGMLGSSALIRKALKDADFDIMSKAWDIQSRSIDKVSSLVQDMLTYSKDREPEKTLTNINLLVREVSQIQEDRAKEQDTVINLELDPALDDIKVNLDRTAIERSVLNLISNGLDAVMQSYLKEGRTGMINVETLYHSDEKKVSIAVTDNGCGIPAENLKKVFEVFFSTKGSRGTGLGLACTNKFIKEHGGEITVSSETEKGSTFTIFLPAE